MFISRKREGDGKPFPNIRRIQKLKFAPVGSASDPLNRQVNHVTSHSNRHEETPGSAMLDYMYFETENEDKLAD